MQYSKFEIIEWLDHCSYSDSKWHTEEEIKELEPINFLTLGFVVKETKDAIRIVSTGGRNGQMSGDFLILKKAIVRRKKLQNPWKDWSK